MPKKRGGRPRKIATLPHLHAAFQQTLAHHTAGSPEHDDVRWTNLSCREIAERLGQQGFDVSTRIVAQLLDAHDYHRRQQFKSTPMGQFPQRNEQFEYIAQRKEACLASTDPVLSIDGKKRELIGPFYRYGWLYSQERLRVYDHDYPRFAEGVVIPHGIFDLKRHWGYLHLGTSHETSAFACDCLSAWWEEHGRQQYPSAQKILLLCDGGGSNNARTYLFKADLQEWVNRLGLPVWVMHYPPYCSKWNPIEHRLFAQVSRACRGMIFSSLEVVKQLMERTQTRTGLRVVVDIVRKVYETGRKVSKQVKQSLNLIRDTFLPQLNYRIEPHTRNREVVS